MVPIKRPRAPEASGSPALIFEVAARRRRDDLSNKRADLELQKGRRWLVEGRSRLLARWNTLTSRISDEVQILQHLGWYAELFRELLIRHPFEIHVPEHKRLGVDLGIVDGDGQVQIIMVGAGVALVHDGLHAMRIAHARQPGFVVQASRIDKERVVSLPMAH